MCLLKNVSVRGMKDLGIKRLFAPCRRRNFDLLLLVKSFIANWDGIDRHSGAVVHT